MTDEYADPEYAAAYDDYWAPVIQGYNAAVLRIAATELASASNVLELASGTGRFTDQIVAAVPSECRVVCVEPAEAMRDLASDRLGQRVEFITEEIGLGGFPIPTDSELFDAVVFGFFLQELEPEFVEKVFLEARRHLQSNGVIAFTAWTENPESAFPDEFEPPVGELVKMLKDAGFAVDHELGPVQHEWTERDAYIEWYTMQKRLGGEDPDAARSQATQEWNDGQKFLAVDHYVLLGRPLTAL